MTKKIIILAVLFLAGIAILIFNRFNLDFNSKHSTIMDVQSIGLAILLISILLTLIPRIRNQTELKVLFIFTIILISSELILSYKSFQNVDRTSFVNNYSNKNCDELLERLEFDKTQNKFAYFSYGLATDSEGIKLKFKENHNVAVIAIGQGCLGNEEVHCYNKALMSYLNKRKLFD